VKDVRDLIGLSPEESLPGHLLSTKNKRSAQVQFNEKYGGKSNILVRRVACAALKDWQVGQNDLNTIIRNLADWTDDAQFMPRFRAGSYFVVHSIPDESFKSAHHVTESTTPHNSFTQSCMGIGKTRPAIGIHWSDFSAAANSVGSRMAPVDPDRFDQGPHPTMRIYPSNTVVSEEPRSHADDETELPAR
jgi:hypothetical protein